jgi:L-ascorbate metabolism protein UlaG (beta-lactamase superfamily)
MEFEGINIERLGHDTFKVTNSKVLYFDPHVLPKDPQKADIILVTHDHFDHCDPDRINEIKKEDTIIVTSKSSSKKLKGNVKIIKPGEKRDIGGGIQIEAVYAYNINKFRSPGVPFHPKSDDFLGFVVTFEGKRIYHAGDSDNIPELQELKDIDVALLPVSGTYVMTVQEAIDAAKVINPRLAIPMHYGVIVGEEKDAQAFRESLKDSGIKVEII